MVWIGGNRIVKAAMTFRDDVSCFSTYAYRCMFNSVFQEKRKETQAGTIPEHQIFYYQAGFDVGHDGDTVNFLDTIPSSDDVEGDVISKVLFEDFNNGMKPRDRMIFQMISDGYKQSEISKVVGCSQPQVSRVRKKLAQYLSI